MLSAAELEHFRTQGWVVARQVLPPAITQAVRAEIDAIVDELAEKLHAEGKLKELHRELGFLHRFPALFKQCPEIKDLLFRNFGFPRATERRPLAGKALFDLLTAQPLLDIMAQLFGEPEVFASGVYRLRPKLPEEYERYGKPTVWHGREEDGSDPATGVVPWHQDQCFFSPRSDTLPESELPPVITAWTPLMNAVEEAGCMEVISPAQPTLHRHYLSNVPAFAGSAPHTIHPDHFPDDATASVVPTMLGDVLLFTACKPAPLVLAILSDLGSCCRQTRPTEVWRTSPGSCAGRRTCATTTRRPMARPRGPARR